MPREDVEFRASASSPTSTCPPAWRRRLAVVVSVSVSQRAWGREAVWAAARPRSCAGDRAARSSGAATTIGPAGSCWSLVTPGSARPPCCPGIALQARQMHMRVARSKCDEIGEACPGAPILGLLRAGRDPLIAPADFEALTELTAQPAGARRPRSRTSPNGDSDASSADGGRRCARADPVSRYALHSLIPRAGGAARRLGLGQPVSRRWRRRRCRRHGRGRAHILRPPPRGAITDIARDRLRCPVNDDEQQLLDAAGGNPFLATQIVEGLARRAESGRDGVPPEFHAAMRFRLSRLSNTRATLIDALAVAGPCRSAIAELSRLCDVVAGPDYNAPSTTAVPRVWSPPPAPNWRSSTIWSGSPSTNRSRPRCGGGCTPAMPNISSPRAQIQRLPPRTQRWRSPSVTHLTPGS